MPELAEVDYFRKQWNPGLGQRIDAVILHDKKRIFRGIDIAKMRKALVGANARALRSARQADAVRARNRQREKPAPGSACISA